MADTAVTLIRCGHCCRSGDIAVHDRRLWCGWCQDWADLDTERVDGVVVNRDHDVPRLVAVPPDETPLHPLRIPSGWCVTWNTLFEEDPTDPAKANGYYYGGVNLFQAHCESVMRVVDVEWRSYEGRHAEGRYLLRVLRLLNDKTKRLAGEQVADWDDPMRTIETVSRGELVAELEAGMSGRRDR